MTLIHALKSWRNTIAQWLSPSPFTSSYDAPLLTCILALVAFGLVMVSSASIIEVSHQPASHALHFLVRHLCFLAICGTCAYFTLSIPISYWSKWSGLLLIGVGILLCLVLTAGKTVNGATRWIAIGPINIQIAELAKFAFTLYMASYLTRKYQEVREQAKGFYKPIVILAFYAILLLLQPDLGSVVVLFVIAVSLLFIAGAKIRDFFIIVLSGLAVIIALALVSPYRLRRISAFMNPWKILLALAISLRSLSWHIAEEAGSEKV